jgi:hypothetical protein
LWVGDTTAETIDASSGNHLEFSDAIGDEEGGEGVAGADNLVKALAQGLDGHTWNSEQSAWEQH